jgi:hypothetical protein
MVTIWLHASASVSWHQPLQQPTPACTSNISSFLLEITSAADGAQQTMNHLQEPEAPSANGCTKTPAINWSSTRTKSTETAKWSFPLHQKHWPSPTLTQKNNYNTTPHDKTSKSNTSCTSMTPKPLKSKVTSTNCQQPRISIHTPWIPMPNRRAILHSIRRVCQNRGSPRHQQNFPRS